MNNQKDPALAIHGLWGDRSQWNHWRTHFTDRDFYPVDLPGHGENYGECELSNLSILDYAHGIIRFVEDTIGRPTHLIGHSAGGLIAQVIAHWRPDLAKSIVLLASDPAKEVEKSIPLQWSFIRPSILKALLSRKEFSLGESESDLVLGGIQGKLWPESGQALYEILFKKIRVPRVGCPVRVIAALNDQFLPVGLEEAVAEHLGANIRVLPGQHMFHMDGRYNDAVISEVRKFLEHVEGRPATFAKAA